MRKLILTIDGYDIRDHLGGFDQNYFSKELESAVSTVRKSNVDKLNTGYVFDERVKSLYPDIKFCYRQSLIGGYGWENLQRYRVHPPIDYSNFICSFNGSAHVSRKLLVSILKKFEWFDPEYCSKNFSYTNDIIDGHLLDYLSQSEQRIYSKFFTNIEETFNQKIFTFDYVRLEHDKNIYSLENKLTKSFLHIVSETMATSYVPFVTEKFLYSIITRGLFLAYAHPGWHEHLERYYGFKRYTKLFDYRFDTIQHPVVRLVELMSMISKFSTLSPADWRDLYDIEKETIEYNYDHYFSNNYKKHLDAVTQS